VEVPAGQSSQERRTQTSEERLEPNHRPVRADGKGLGLPVGAARPCRLGIVGGDRLFADILSVALKEHGMQVVVTTGMAEAVREVGRSRPDLVLIDLDRNKGTELGKVLLQHDGALKIAGLTGTHEERTFRESVRAGFHAYLTKETSLSAFVAALRRTIAGRLVRPPRASRRSSPERRTFLQPVLTSRERQVLRLLVEGAGQKDMARRMSISPHTVRTHIQSILVKLQVHTRLEAAAWASKNGLSASLCPNR
jgi:two-component system, NarL family, nitrate/nitrite response regulator NarL